MVRLAPSLSASARFPHVLFNGRRAGCRPPLEARPPSCRGRPGCREPDRARRRLDERACRWPARPRPQRCAATRQSFPGRTPPPRPRLTDRRSPAAGQFAQIFPRRARRARPEFAGQHCRLKACARPATAKQVSVPDAEERVRGCETIWLRALAGRCTTHAGRSLQWSR